MDTYLVVQCAQYLSRYAKPAECRLLLSLVFFAFEEEMSCEANYSIKGIERLKHEGIKKEVVEP